MLVVKSRMRNSPQKFLYSIILIIISCIAVIVLYFYQTIFNEVVDSIIDSNKRMPTLLGLLIGVYTVIVLSIIIIITLIFGFEDFLNGKFFNIIRLWKKYLEEHEMLLYVILFDFFACLWLYFADSLKLNAVFSIVSASVLFACFFALSNYDDVDLSSAQNMEKSIGASWACGACVAFYEKILLDMPKRLSQFEKENGITLLVKKLVLICPLSCNANGSLDGRDGEISAYGKLEEIIEDEGANNNRTYKSNVYKICEQYYVAAEIPSPLATLYGMRDIIDPAILQYHRLCFIETLKDLLKTYQCIILEYDDLNPTQSLHSFLLSELKVEKFVDVIK